MPRSSTERARPSEGRYMSSILIGASILFMACQLPGVTQPSERVEMSETDFKEFWRQLENRMNAYFCDVYITGRACEFMPELPPWEEEYPKFKWIEKGPKAVWGGTCTCSHGDRSTVTVPSDEWYGGCTPHEMGHGVLNRLKHPCWSSYEHQKRAPESCKIRRENW